MRIYFVRHGQSENNALWDETGMRHVRIEDPVLTELGQRQSACAARFLAGLKEPFKHVYCSLMLRAVQTAECIGSILALPVTAWTDLHEVGGMYVEDEIQQGKFLQRSGKNRTYFQQHHPSLALPAEVTDAGWWQQPFEDESARPARAARVWQQLNDRHGNSDEALVLVTHLGFYNMMMSLLAGSGNAMPLWFHLDNAGVTRLDVGARIEIAYMNCAAVTHV